MPLDLRELELVFRRIVQRWTPDPVRSYPPGNLTVTIQSFSFRHGYPGHTDAHGGGSVFDCRGLPNPGRIPELEPYTGRDRVIIDWLERSPPVQEFWENVQGISDLHIEAFLDRGFGDLAFSFGCTGGRHRSVFMAGKLADHIRARFPNVAVVVKHREI
jgi:RNase adaptor protein for sRNA GlmZ degradation